MLKPRRHLHAVVAPVFYTMDERSNSLMKECKDLRREIVSSIDEVRIHGGVVHIILESRR